MSDNQHYITKAYLDKFVHANSSQKILFPYDKDLGSLGGKGTKRLGSAEDFYVQKAGESLTNKLDETRKAAETLFFASGKRTSGPVAKCIYDDDFLPGTEEQCVLAGAATFLWCGSPVQIHNTAMMGLMANQMYLFNRLNTERAKELYKTRYDSEADRRLQEDRKAVLQGDLTVDVGEEDWKQLGFESFRYGPHFLAALSDMGLTVCTCHYKSFFLTSDNPVVTTSDERPDRPGVLLKDAEVWFPISYKKGLLWSWKHKGVSRDCFGHSKTRAMNRRIIRWCYKKVYSPLRDVWIEAAMKENSFDPCYGHYGSLQQLIDGHTAPAVMITGKSQNVGEIVDLTAGLRAGEKCDVVKL
jgi:hypothetical protein